MTAEIPKPESSKSSSFPALASFGLAAAGLSLVFAFSLTPISSQNESRTPRNYENIFSHLMLGANLPAGSLSVLDPEKKIVLPSELVTSWLNNPPVSRENQPDRSLLQYFYAQTGTAHPWTGYRAQDKVRGFTFHEENIGNWILELAHSLNRMPQDAQLVIENGRAVLFREHLDGYVLSPKNMFSSLTNALLDGNRELAVPLETRSPKIRLADLNHLGINERVVTGQSDFSGSSASRINNIRVGAAQYNGIILAPGEEFSFNKYLGPVDAEHGFRPELVIKPEGATPEFGGGLCQVSTTAFRAAFFGGLPITARRNHSYAVRYYEWIADDSPRAVGLDATIYAPYQDMKFVNDTPGSLLIWTRIEDKRLYFDYYGTPDDRGVAVDGPHPFDKRPSGAVKSTVSRTVSKDGKSEEITFNSVYIPPKVAEQSFELPAAPPISIGVPNQVGTPELNPVAN